MMWEQGCGSGDEDDAEEGDDAGNLLVASKRLVKKQRTGPAGDDGSKEGDDRGVR